MASRSEAGPQAAATAQDAGGEAAGEAQAVEPFTLDITFSGLVLLVQQKVGKKLLVLLPRAEGHPAHGPDGRRGMPEHVAVLGTQPRYDPTGPFVRKNQFCEYKLAKGTLTFDPPLKQEPKREIRLNLDKFDVGSLTGATDQPPIPERAWVQMDVTAGGACVDCAHDDGARWMFRGEPRQMATRMSWRIPDLVNEEGGRRVVRVTFTPKDGAPQHFSISPQPDPVGAQDRAVLYLYNTPEDELPSHVGHPSPPDVGENEENHHFAAFYELFDPKPSVPLPKLIDEDDEDDDIDGEDDEGVDTESAATRADDPDTLADARSRSGLKERVAAARQERFAEYHGRLYTCTLARIEAEPAAASQADAGVAPGAGAVRSEGAGTGDEAPSSGDVTAEDA